jgi:hypothetical protein
VVLAAAAAGLVSVAGCGGDDGGTGVTLRRLQDAALLAEGDKTRCPLDLELPDAISGATPVTGDGAATGTSVGKAPTGSSLVAAGGASYRCAYQVGGKPLSLVVVAVPEGRSPADAAGALATPLQGAGLDQAAATAVAEAAKGAKAGTGVAAPSGTASASTASLPGGGAASVALVAAEGGPSGKTLTTAAEKLAATLEG